jgi:hypothetical protein
MLQALRDPLKTFTDFAVQPVAYIVFGDGVRYYVKNGFTGAIEYSGVDASDVINRALAMAPEGGRVALRGEFIVGGGKAISIPSKSLTIEGPARIVKLATTSFERAVALPPGSTKDIVIRGLEFDLTRVTVANTFAISLDYSYIQNVSIEGNIFRYPVYSADMQQFFIRMTNNSGLLKNVRIVGNIMYGGTTRGIVIRTADVGSGYPPLEPPSEILIAYNYYEEPDTSPGTSAAVGDFIFLENIGSNSMFRDVLIVGNIANRVTHNFLHPTFAYYDGVMLVGNVCITGRWTGVDYIDNFRGSIVDIGAYVENRYGGSNAVYSPEIGVERILSVGLRVRSLAGDIGIGVAADGETVLVNPLLEEVGGTIFVGPKAVVIGGVLNGRPMQLTGVATIPAGQVRVTVSHRLPRAPGKIFITPIAQPPGKLWVENITSTSFDIVTDTAPASDLRISWYAEV